MNKMSEDEGKRFHKARREEMAKVLRAALTANYDEDIRNADVENTIALVASALQAVNVITPPFAYDMTTDNIAKRARRLGNAFIVLGNALSEETMPEDDDDACTDCGNKYVYEVDAFPENARKYRTGYCSGERQVCAYCANGLTYGEA